MILKYLVDSTILLSRIYSFTNSSSYDPLICGSYYWNFDLIQNRDFNKLVVAHYRGYLTMIR
jgi:hypothetical protein